MDAYLKQKLLNIQALAERGVGGEKLNAARMLADLLEKYDISIDDLNDEPELQEYWFKYNTVFEKKLLHQIVGKVLKISQVTYYKHKNNTSHGFDLTEEQYEEISRSYDFYRKELKDEMQLLFHAFIQKHQLVAPSPDPKEDENEVMIRRRQNVDKEYLRRLFNMMESLNSAFLPAPKSRQLDIGNNC